ncbi:MAG: TrkH family potassium uptake protein [Gammaproteobacteria bacterium]
MAAEQLSTLTYAVRGRVLGRYLGQLGLMLAALALVPLAAAIALGDMGFARRCGEASLLLVSVCLPLSRLRASGHLQANEALAVTALAFVLASLVMSWPFMALGIPFVDAWFEAASGVTTTGLSTLATVADKSPGFLFARAWMQWYGGLGIAVLWVALLFNHQFAMRRLVESSGAENLITTARMHARRVLAIYGLLTLAGIAALLALREDAFSAVTHVLSAVSTGGFSIHDDSLAGMGEARYALSAVSLCGAVALPLYFLLYQRRWAAFARDAELWALLAMTAAVSLLLWLFLWRDGLAAGPAFGHAIVMGVSAQTTTGFSSLTVADLGAAAKWVLLLAMFTGGCVGSTAGGIKMLRLLVFARLLQLSLRRTALPAHAVVEPWLGGRILGDDDIQRALMVIVLYGLGVTLSWLPFLLAGHAPLDALLEVVSATGTVGLSSGITRPDLAPSLKLVLIADMLFGRVEFFALLVVLWPRTWFGKRDSAL